MKGFNGHHLCDPPLGLVWKHSLQPLISTQRKVITGPHEVLTGSRSPIIIKMHGELSSKFLHYYLVKQVDDFSPSDFLL